MSQPSQSTGHIYTPLKSYQTRLVKLLAGSFNDLIRCELHVADMLFDEGMGVASEPDAVIYKALSYSWGHPETTAPIECNSQQLLIPPAMLDALQYLRLEDQDTWWWCDALSISQSDPVEKSQQVKQMLLIFAKAEEVVAWLGLPDSDYTDNAKMIDSLSRREFWKRAWIDREMYAARKVTFRCGAHCLDIESFGTKKDLDLLDYVKKVPVLDFLRHPQVPCGGQGSRHYRVKEEAVE